MKKQINSTFRGFSPEVVKFFQELKVNNNKEWFAEHKPFYEKHIKDTAKALLSDMGERFAKLGLPFIADPKKSMFRIYRDIRFSANKEPYKTNLGLIFPYTMAQMNKLPVQSLGLYYHIESDESFIAGGIHAPEPSVLKAVRSKIAADWDEFEDIINDNKLKKEFPDGFYGEKLKRMPQGFPADHPGGDYLRLKEYTIFSDISPEESYSAGILDLIERKAIAATRFFEFIFEAL